MSLCRSYVRVLSRFQVDMGVPHIDVWTHKQWASILALTAASWKTTLTSAEGQHVAGVAMSLQQRSHKFFPQAGAEAKSVLSLVS